MKARSQPVKGPLAIGKIPLLSFILRRMGYCMIASIACVLVGIILIIFAWLIWLECFSNSKILICLNNLDQPYNPFLISDSSMCCVSRFLMDFMVHLNYLNLFKLLVKYHFLSIDYLPFRSSFLWKLPPPSLWPFYFNVFYLCQ